MTARQQYIVKSKYYKESISKCMGKDWAMQW